MSLKEYLDKEQCLNAYKNFVFKNKTTSVSLLEALDPYLRNMIFYHFSSYNNVRSLVEDELQQDQIEYFTKYWRGKRKKGNPTFFKMFQDARAKRQNLTTTEALEISKKIPEFAKCRTKKDLRLFLIRAFSDYNTPYTLEEELWTELSKQKRIKQGKTYQSDTEIIDALEYSSSGLYGGLGEDLFEIYARRKRWLAYKTRDFLLSIIKNKPIEKLSYYQYNDILKDLLSIFILKKLTPRGKVETLLKRGIPDFIVWKLYEFKEKPFFVEIKSNTSIISPQQKRLFSELNKTAEVFIFKIKIPDIAFEVSLNNYNY